MTFSALVVTDQTPRVGLWAIEDQGDLNDPSSWLVRGNSLMQTSGIFGTDSPLDPGTMAIAGDAGWQDYAYRVRCRSEGDGAVGLVFRYRDYENYYRLSVDAGRGHRRLVRVLEGAASILWDSSESYTPGQPFELAVELRGRSIVAYFNGIDIATVEDEAHDHGRLGVYARSNDGVVIEHVEATDLSRQQTPLFVDRFEDDDLTDWTVVDLGSEAGPAAWAISHGALQQSQTCTISR